MKYLIKEMREVVLINNLPHIKKWKETFEVLEVITQKKLFNTQFVMQNFMVVFLFQQE
jgi:hypothetical protein